MSEQPSLVMVITTAESAGDAQNLAQVMLDQSLAACVQIEGPIISHYRWKGQTEASNEYRLMIKTTRAAWPALKIKLGEVHPYDEPEIIMVPVEDASDGYRQWVVDQTA